MKVRWSSVLALAVVFAVTAPCLAQTAAATAPSAALPPSLHPPIKDWSRALVDSTLQRSPDPAKFGGWGYAKALYLTGQYFVYKRTHDPHYLQYIEAWMDTQIDSEGHFARKIDSLDAIMPSNLLLILYQETHQEKYKKAAEQFRHRFDDYPRTSDGGFWHAAGESRAYQLWGDGIFMGMPFLVRYGAIFGDADYANDEATKQIVTYYKHLHDPNTGLLFHAYDESGKTAWSNTDGHHSAEFWGRAMGWFGMATVDILDALPKDHPRRQELIAIVHDLVPALAKYQDPKTGLWFQVVNKGDVEGNWLETSSSSMYTYITDVAVRRGYVDKRYKKVAEKGYQGVLSKVTRGDDGLVNIADIGEGTNVSDLAYYFARKRPLNDPHGLGAFLLMNEEFTTGKSSMQQILGNYKPGKTKKTTTTTQAGH
jgi:unsaturated rhamnogalacturonyl hydrolase